VITYNFQTLAKHPRLGFVIHEDEVRPALFLTPAEAKEMQPAPIIRASEDFWRMTIARIQTVVADYYGFDNEHMRSSDRHRRYAYPRQIAMLLARELTKASLPDIGSRFGGKHHTTVIHGIRNAKSNIETDPDWRRDYDALRERLAA